MLLGWVLAYQRGCSRLSATVVRARRAARGTLYTRGGVWERTLSITFMCRPRQSLRRAHRSEYAKHDSKTMRSNPCCNRAVITAEPNLSLQLTCHSITCSISTVPTTTTSGGGGEPSRGRRPFLWLPASRAQPKRSIDAQERLGAAFGGGSPLWNLGQTRSLTKLPRLVD